MPLVSVRVQHFVIDDAIAAIPYAGPNQSVLCISTVQLQGEILGDDLANHTFEWEQTSGNAVVLNNADTLSPWFISNNIDLEFTLYVDRNTPYEASDTVFINNTPTETIGAATFYGTATSAKLSGSATIASRSISDQLMLSDVIVTASTVESPPVGYSPLYTAEDVYNMRRMLSGQYWLMNDIDMGEYASWKPIGDSLRPFSGELQGNGFSIENLSITSTPITKASDDPNFGSVVFLASFENAAANATTYTPEIGGVSFEWLNHSGATEPTQVDGQIETAQSKFGTKSIYAKETAGGVSAGWQTTALTAADYLSFAGDFTIEMHVYIVDNTSEIPLMAFGDFGQYKWELALEGGSGRLNFRTSSNGTVFTGPLSQEAWGGGATGFTTGSWQHLAICRSGDNWYAWKDGVLMDGGSITAAITIQNTIQGYLCIMQEGQNDGAGTIECYIDNIRITDSVARYTTGFTPPSAPFSANITKPAGLFSYIGNGATIEQVSLTNANISGVDSGLYKGILVGSAQGPSTDDGGTVTVRNVYVEGTIDSGGANAGGLIGHTGTNVSSTFENTLADVNVTEANTDPLYPQVQFLASFDGADLQTTYTEQSQNALVATFQTGSSRIRTTEFYSSPSSYNNNSGTARLEFPNDAALQLGSGDFTIEFFLNFVSLSGGNTFVAGHYGTSGNRPWALLVDAAAGDWLVRLNGSTVVDFTPITPLVTDKWYHVVLERNGNEWQFGVDGIRENSGALVGAMQTADDVLTWGGNFNSGAVSFLNGYIDDARITIGTARYDLASNETYDIPETPFATSTVSASVAGWAGNFQTEGVYNDNYWNTSKIDQGTGTGGDTPIAGEVDGLSGSALKTQSNYTNWDFDTVWYEPQNGGFATLQEKESLVWRNQSGMETMLQWQRQQDNFAFSTATGANFPGTGSPEHHPPLYDPKGAYVEKKVGNTWVPYLQIPPQHRFFNLAPEEIVRIYWRWQKRGGNIGTRDIEVLHPIEFRSRDVAGVVPNRPAGTSPITATSFWGMNTTVSNNLSVTITNPRKIALQESDTIANGLFFGHSNTSTESHSFSVQRYSAINLGPESDTIASGLFFGSASATEGGYNLSVQRDSGTNIGGG
jgi:hypothetical protein